MNTAQEVTKKYDHKYCKKMKRIQENKEVFAYFLYKYTFICIHIPICENLCKYKSKIYEYFVSK